MIPIPMPEVFWYRLNTIAAPVIFFSKTKVIITNKMIYDNNNYQNFIKIPFCCTLCTAVKHCHELGIKYLLRSS